MVGVWVDVDPHERVSRAPFMGRQGRARPRHGTTPKGSSLRAYGDCKQEATEPRLWGGTIYWT